MKSTFYIMTILLLLNTLGSLLFAHEDSIESLARMGKLSNGFTYYIQENRILPGKVDFLLLQKCGSMNETNQESGFSHFIEHLAFNATKHFPSQSHLSYLQTLGLRVGENFNGSTTFTETQYQIFGVPIANDSTIDSVLWILRDWLAFPLIVPEAVEAERINIRAEASQRSVSNILLFEKILPKLFPDYHPISWLPIGSSASFEACTALQLQNFFSKWYRPDMQAIIVSGDINALQVERKLAVLFDSITAINLPPLINIVRVEENHEPLVAIFVNSEIHYSRAMLMFKLPAMFLDQGKGVKFWEREMMQQVIMTMINNRLNKNLNIVHSPFRRSTAFLGDYVFPFTCPTLTFDIDFSFNAIDAGIIQCFHEIELMYNAGFTSNEFEEASQFIFSSYFKRNQNRTSWLNSDYCRYYRSQFLSNLPMESPSRETFLKLFSQLSLDSTQLFFNQIVGHQHNLAFTLITSQNSDINVPSEEQIKFYLSSFLSSLKK